jgi:hypothetical protein
VLEEACLGGEMINKPWICGEEEKRKAFASSMANDLVVKVFH